MSILRAATQIVRETTVTFVFHRLGAADVRASGMLFRWQMLYRLILQSQLLSELGRTGHAVSLPLKVRIVYLTGINLWQHNRHTLLLFTMRLQTFVLFVDHLVKVVGILSG